jgi:hypothetical protein
MALGSQVFQTFTTTVTTAGTSVAASPAPYDNTHTVRVRNNNATAIIYVADTSAGGSISATALIVAPGTYQDLPLGVASQRTKNQFVLAVDSDTNGATAVITYFNASAS